nr:immunoglobulin light chain junction region [Macaca mulatta]MOW09344.1 immunoglobulin light chain junction region [Macaca mulatta]MOW10307.1 immunoglobulin light chain junction region [Macaca mulatta]
CQQYSDWPYSF